MTLESNSVYIVPDNIKRNLEILDAFDDILDSCELKAKWRAPHRKKKFNTLVESELDCYLYAEKGEDKIYMFLKSEEYLAYTINRRAKYEDLFLSYNKNNDYFIFNDDDKFNNIFKVY